MAHPLTLTLTLIAAVILGSLVAWLTLFILLAIDRWRAGSRQRSRRR